MTEHLHKSCTFIIHTDVSRNISQDNDFEVFSFLLVLKRRYSKRFAYLGPHFNEICILDA
jgi:hypothetical protein